MNVDVVMTDDLQCITGSAETADEKMWLSMAMRSGALATAGYYFYVLWTGLAWKNLTVVLLLGIVWSILHQQVQFEADVSQACWNEVFVGWWTAWAVPCTLLIMVGFDARNEEQSSTEEAETLVGSPV